MAGECTKRIDVLVLLLLVCFTIHAQCRCIEADKEVQLAYIKSQPIPRCCLDKHNDYCCSLNLACYDTLDLCTANCSISLSSATVFPSSSSSVLP
ncbi:hypothetical protein ZWY2020_026396 [Hordeum vulgare]|uniref:Acidic protein n=1 Tax=Hordeum vulgare subsp. vulgare TaxID=112509 RepID=A0A8I6XA76_HORVV|nr:hypothetical protein ZWY2020_026396 [Hordeum vulgare]